MIETAIYVLIGALSTALVFLLAIPAISRRAHRLAQRRASLTAPLSAAEARADRDALRAKHAVEVVAVERRAAAAETQWAQAQIALGRQSTEILARDDALHEKQQELARRAGEIDRLGAELTARDAEIGARETALFDLAGQREAAERRAAEAAAQAQAQQMRFDENRADLEGRIAALTRELSDFRHESAAALAAGQARVAELRRRLEDSEAELERLREGASPLAIAAAPALPSLSASVQGEQARFDEARAALEGRIAALTRELGDSRLVANEAQARADELRRRLEDSEAEAERLREAAPPPGLPRAQGLVEPAPPADSRENELSLRVNELMAAREEAEAALIAARHEAEAAVLTARVDRESLEREVAALGERLQASENRAGRLREGDALLRQAIARLGREMAEAGAAISERETATTL